MATASESNLEEVLKKRGLTFGARISPAQIDALIAASEVQYYVFPGTTVTVCCLRLPNGYCIVGKASAIALENFNAEMGRVIALDDARREIWALEAYLLKQRLADGWDPRQSDPDAELTDMWRSLVEDVGINQANHLWPGLDPRRGGAGYHRGDALKPPPGEKAELTTIPGRGQ